MGSFNWHSISRIFEVRLMKKGILVMVILTLLCISIVTAFTTGGKYVFMEAVLDGIALVGFWRLD